MSTPSPTPAAPEVVACSLSPAELGARRKQLIPGLSTRAEAVTDLPDGLRFRFTHTPGLISELAGIIEQEQDCCSFLRFQLAAAPGAGAVTLDVTDPEGTAAMLRGL